MGGGGDGGDGGRLWLCGAAGSPLAGASVSLYSKTAIANAAAVRATGPAQRLQVQRRLLPGSAGTSDSGLNARPSRLLSLYSGSGGNSGVGPPSGSSVAFTTSERGMKRLHSPGTAFLSVAT